MRLKKKRSPFGSSRTSYFREKKNAARETRQRGQKVKFRRRYAQSVIKDAGVKLWLTVKLGVLAAFVATVFVGSRHFWETNERLKISNVAYVGARPSGLEDFLSIHPGQNIFSLSVGKMQANALQKFPELKSVTIRRFFDRHVIISAEYRKPVLCSGADDHLVGIDVTGQVFRLSADNRPAVLPPLIENIPNREELAAIAATMDELSRRKSDFYALVKILKTDRMLPLRLYLVSDVIVVWDDMRVENCVERANKVMTILERFEPTKSGATIRFVADDRLVIDSNWKTKSKPQ